MKTTLKDGDKLGHQFRTVSLERAAGTVIDEEKRLVRNVSISSEEPYDRFYGTEILSHAPEAVNLQRFEAKAAPLLLNHDRNKLLGKPQNARIENKRVVCDLQFSTNALAKECFQDLLDGILTECSIGYDVTKFEVDEEEETYTATRWELFETSMVTIPADFSVGVGREGENEGREISVTNKKNIDGTQEQSQKHLTQPTPMAEPTVIELPKIDETKLRSDAVTAERKRVNDISDLEKHFREKGLGGRKIDTSEACATHIREGKTKDEFREFVVMNEFKEVKVPVNTPEALPNGNGNGQEGAGIIVGGARPYTIEARTLGELFVRSNEFRAQNRGKHECSLEVNAFDNFRATFTTGSVTGYSGIIAAPQINLLGVQRPTVADLLAQGTTALGAVPYVQELAFTNAATVVAQATEKPEATFTLEQKSAPVRKIAVTIPVSDEAFEDIATLESYINARLRHSVEMTEEAELLNGDGTGAHLTGIMQTSGIQTQAKGADAVADAIYKGMTKVKSIGFASPSGLVIHPNDMQDLRLSKDANNQYYGGGPFTGSYGTPFVDVVRIWGLPTVETTSIAENTALIVTGMDAMIFRKKGITIDSTNSHASEFTSNITRLRGEERLALAVLRPKSFCTVTGI